MSVVLTIAGKKYSIASELVAVNVLNEAAGIINKAALEVPISEASSEGQMSALLAMRCVVPLLQERSQLLREREDFEKNLEEILKQLGEITPQE